MPILSPRRSARRASAMALATALATALVLTAGAAPATASAPATAFHVLRPSAHPVELRSRPRPLAVSYTYGGERRTLDDFLARTGTNGFVVLDAKDGQDIVAERYTDATRATRFQSWSVAKSFTSAAVGVAVGEGRIRSIDEPVTAYLPELAGSGYDGVSIRDLLRMSSGIRWTEGRDVPRVQAAANRGASLRRIAARQERGREPGSRFEYASMNSFVLAWLVTAATGVPYERYVESRIWRPAGMASTARVDADGRGDSRGYCCYHATDRDFARFGLLYLRGGRAGGRQVVPASWVAESTRPSSAANPRYGLHWWLGGDGGRDFMAAGFGGQYVYVSPEHQVVIVRSARSTARPDQDEAVAAFRAAAAEVARTRHP